MHDSPKTMQAPQDVSDAQGKAVEEQNYNDRWIESLNMERARAADAYDNYSRAANFARERMEACDAAMGSYESTRAQPSLVPR